MNKSKTVLWHFCAKSPLTPKTYVVMCVPCLKSGKNLIKAALNKLQAGEKLVIVCDSYTEVEFSEAESKNYSLITLKDINRYGMEMLEIRQRESIELAV